MIRAGIFGATGYTGHELATILERHPGVTTVFATSASSAGRTLADLYPAAPPLALVDPTDAPLDAVDVVFLCLPHAAAAPTAVRALEAGVRVVDLSADFRLRDAAVYSEWYHCEHPAPDLLAEAVYGLTEFARDELPGARLVATPGCYPTGALLALQPLLAARAIAGPIIVDAKSGVSGAGRKPSDANHFITINNNFSPYKIGRAHRHVPEMEQAFRRWHDDPPALIFSPHLLPVPRGILSTIYAPLANGWPEAALRDLFVESYADEPFIQVLPGGRLATLAHVTHSNHCAISVTRAGDTVIITSAIDNLVKGAAGQAVQNMNVVFDRPETAGLL